MAMTREEILKLNDIQTKVIQVPQWGGKEVRIKQFGAGELGAYRNKLAQLTEEEKEKQRSAILCSMGIVNDDGTRAFEDCHILDLQRKNGYAIEFIAIEILDFNSLSVTAQKEMTKN